MVGIKFFKYIQNSIMHLWLDDCDIPRKRVMIKIDSRPGRLNPDLLAECHIHGYHLTPGVPNSITITQEIDKNYDTLNSIFWTKLFTMRGSNLTSLLHYGLGSLDS